MNILPRIRHYFARFVAGNRFTRVAFKRLALDDKMLLLILNDPLCATRVSSNRPLADRITQLAASNPFAAVPSQQKPLETSPSEPAQHRGDPITDISVGINWGPKAFPLGRHALYFRSGMRQLTERWLRRLPSDACVIILADLTAEEEAQVMFTRFRQVKALITLPPAGSVNAADTEVFRQLAAFRALDAVVIPLPVEHKGIEFIPGNTVPNVGPAYALFRRLWHLGFRQFAHLSFCGLRQMEIPLLLDCFMDKHKGQRCFIAGNGPSLNKLDMGLLKNEITFGSNRCYLGFMQWGFFFNYWACVDRLQLEEYGLEYQDNLPESMVKFLPFEYMPMLQFPNCCPVNFDYDGRPPYKFSGSPEVLRLGFTVTHALLQIAVIMGCNPIYLIGVDHRYDLSPKTVQNRRFGEKQAKIWVAEDSTKPTHFTDKYTAGESPKLFITPKPEKAEACFEVARKWLEENNIEILNATPDTGLQVFNKVDYASLFK